MTAVRTTENCRFCWMCRQVCPVGHVTARETLTPHAWALTIESVLRGQLTWNRETAAVMYACADCGLCQSHCVTDQPLPDAIVAARAEIVRAGAAPEAVAALDRRLRTFANAYADRSPVRTTKPGTVALFVGDSADHQATADAALRLLNAAGLDAVPICEGRSSALLANTLGLQETAETLAREVVREVTASGAREVLVLAPGDRWTFEYVYPTRLGVAWPNAIPVRGAGDVIAEALSSGRLRFSQKADGDVYAYHDPCHTPRLPDRQTIGRTLAAAVLGVAGSRELFWRGGRAHPCGAIGGLEHTSPDIAAALARARFDDAAEDQVRTIVTEDPGCAAHLMRHRAHGIDVVNLYALLDRHIRTD